MEKAIIVKARCFDYITLHVPKEVCNTKELRKAIEYWLDKDTRVWRIQSLIDDWKKAEQWASQK